MIIALIVGLLIIAGTYYYLFFYSGPPTIEAAGVSISDWIIGGVVLAVFVALYFMHRYSKKKGA